jgi:predicted nucleic acid-binding protein
LGQLDALRRRGETIYFDTAPIIYSVEKHDDYWHLLLPLWRSLKSQEIAIVTSELTLLETLIQPIRQSNQTLITAYETLLTKTEINVFPITRDVLREAANLRAKQNFKTPDAIHSATAAAANCTYFLTNDSAFQRLSSLQVIVLSELV